MLKFAANLSMLFTELPFLDRFEASAKAGFTGVEYLFPYAYPADDLVDRLQRHGLTQVLFNMPPGNWDAGERGIACLPDRVAEFADGIEVALRYAMKLNCKQVHCMAGLMPRQSDLRVLNETYIANVQRAADAFAEHGILLLIEPINTQDMPGYFLSRTADALALIERIGRPNVRLQYDCYHMHIMEGALPETIERHLGSIAHIQIADAPGRHEPGTGEIRYAEIFAHLERIGYDGWIGCEYRAGSPIFARRRRVRPGVSGQFRARDT
jgi:hydroxypyruvate isomerase